MPAAYRSFLIGVLAVLGLLAAPWRAYAEKAPPEILAHSQLEFAVKKGDTVVVHAVIGRVAADGHGNDADHALAV